MRNNLQYEYHRRMTASIDLHGIKRDSKERPAGRSLILFHGSIDAIVLLLEIVVKARKPCRACA